MALTPTFPAPTGRQISSVESRRAFAGLVVRDAAGNPRAGILPRHSSDLVTSRATMGVDVAGFEAVLVRTGYPSLIDNDGVVTVSVGGAPTSNSRIDVVYVKQNESSSPFSDASNDPVLGYVSSPVAAVPSLAAALALLPAGALALASVLIPSTATTTQSSGVAVTQLFPYTALTGDPIWVRNSAELAALDVLGEATQVYKIDTKVILARVGSTWQPTGGVTPFAEAAVVPVVAIAASQWGALALASPALSSEVDWSGSNPGRLVAKYRGRYRAEGQALLGSTGFVQGRIRVNGATAYNETISPIRTGNVGNPFSSAEFVLSAGDYAEFQIVSSTGGDLSSGRFTLSYIGAAQ